MELNQTYRHVRARGPSKDQTTEGILLLDEFRRYLITETNSGVNRYYMTVNGDVAPQTTDPTDMSAKYIQG